MSSNQCSAVWGKACVEFKLHSRQTESSSPWSRTTKSFYQQEFIGHGGFDLRLLVIGDEVLAMRRENPQHWVTNIAQGGRGFAHQATEMEKELAWQAARSVGALIAGVDLLYDQQSMQPFVIEVNSSPAWQATSKVLQIDVAKMILNELRRQSVS